MNLLETIESETLTARSRDNVDVRPGDTVRVHVRVREGEKTRTQIFEGTVIKIRNSGPSTTFTVRKISNGIGVERIFPACSPNLVKIEVTARHKVRRAKLYFLRDRQGKAMRLTPIRDFRGIFSTDTKKKKKRGKRRRAAARAETQQ